MISSDDVTPDDAVAVNAEGRSVDRKKEIPAQKSPAKARNATLNFKNPSTIYRLNPGFYKLLSEHKDDLPKIHLKLYQAQIQSPQELEGIPEFIGKALRHFPDNLVLNFVNADLAMMTGRPLSGIIGFKRLLGIVEKMDSPANALFILQQLLDQFPLDVILLEKKAEALGQLGRAEEGAQALMVAAKHYEDEKLFKPATQCLFKGLSLFPGIWALSFNLGHCFLGMPSAKYALEGLNRMLSKSPQNPALYLTRGLLNSRLGDDENADLDFTLSVELCERDVTALTVLQELAGSDAPHELLSRIRTKIKVLDPGVREPRPLLRPSAPPSRRRDQPRLHLQSGRRHPQRRVQPHRTPGEDLLRVQSRSKKSQRARTAQRSSRRLALAGAPNFLSCFSFWAWRELPPSICITRESQTGKRSKRT